MSACPTGCSLAIVGSVELEDNFIAELMVDTILAEHQPRAFTTGIRKGVQTYAINRAGELHISVAAIVAHPVPFAQRTGNRFHDSGAKGVAWQIVDMAECVVRIYASSSSTFGSGWIADEARRQGKRVFTYEVDTGPKPEPKVTF